MIIHFIRHTTPKVAPGVCYGQADLELISNSQAEIDKVKLKLLSHYDRIYSSPLKRCSQLAEQLTEHGVSYDDRLKEYNFGEWELQPWEKLNGSRVDTWMNDFVNTRPPGGESLVEMKSRVDEFITELIDQDCDVCAVVAHAGVLRLLYSWVLDVSLENIFSIRLDYGSIVEVSLDTNTSLKSLKHL
jgi:alpha-ribazole phosphatase